MSTPTDTRSTRSSVGGSALDQALHAMGVATILEALDDVAQLEHRVRTQARPWTTVTEHITARIVTSGGVPDDLADQLDDAAAQEQRNGRVLAGLAHVHDRLQTTATARRRDHADQGLAVLHDQLQHLLADQPDDAPARHRDIRGAQLAILIPALGPADTVRDGEQPDQTGRLLVDVLGYVRDPARHIDVAHHLLRRPHDLPRGQTLGTGWAPDDRAPGRTPWSTEHPHDAWQFLLAHRTDAWVPTTTQLRSQLDAWRAGRAPDTSGPAARSGPRSLVVTGGSGGWTTRTGSTT